MAFLFAPLPLSLPTRPPRRRRLFTACAPASPSTTRPRAARVPPHAVPSHAPPSAAPPSAAPSPVEPPSDAPSAASAEAFLLSLGISAVESRRAVSRLPRLSETRDLRAASAATLAYLRGQLRLDARQVARAVRHAPHILLRDAREFEARREFLENVARIPPRLVPAAAARCPHVLWMNLKTAAEVVEVVVAACPRIAPASLGEVFGRVPQALIMAPDKVRANIENVRKAGVGDAAALGRIFTKAPLVLIYDPKTVAKRVAYLSEELGFSARTVGRIIVSTPEVLEQSVDKVLRPRSVLLQSLVGDDAVAAVVDKVPFIYGIDDILDRVLWLRDEVGLDNAQIRSVIRDAPAILAYSVVGNLAPKWAFITDTMGGTRDDLVGAPREALCANLQQRAMPRYAFLASSSMTDVPVLDILRGSDAEFCRNVAKCDPDTFRSYVDNDTYLLFFSQLI